LGFLHVFDGPIEVWWSNAAVVSNVLVGCSGGRSATALSGAEPLTVIRRALDQLGRHFPDVGDLSCHVADWRLLDCQSDRGHAAPTVTI
jgi:hypothetical protein